MKRRILVVSALFIVCVLGTLSVLGLKSVNSFKSYKNSISTGNLNSTIAASLEVNSKFKLITKISGLPLVHQLLQISNLDFTNNKSDLSAIIDASPYLAGVERPLHYLVAFQNTAEARGTGGILGAYAILRIDKGKISIEKSGSNASLASLPEIPVPVTNEFLNLYGKNPAILQNSNLSPHLPYGAEIWMGLWKAQTGEVLDGVIAVDPTSLSYVLEATGPIQVNGRQINSQNLVSETLKDAYKRYEKDNAARKQYLVEIINSTAKKLITGEFSRLAMLKAINRGISEERLLIYSRNSEAEKYISKTKLGAYLNTTLNNEYRVVIQNIDASKLDYYLKKEVTIKNTSCDKPQRNTVSVVVTNTLKTGKGLPAYVLTRADKNQPADLVTGQHKFKVFIYGPVGSKIVSAWRENLSYGIGGQATERMRPVMVMEVDLAPLESEKLQVNFAGGNGKVKFVDQPLVIPTKIDIKGGC